MWRGGSKSEFEAILTALRRAEIPLLFRERPNVRGAVRSSLLNISRPSHQHVTHDTEFEVKVLRSDEDRAREAVRLATEIDETDED